MKKSKSKKIQKEILDILKKEQKQASYDEEFFMENDYNKIIKSEYRPKEGYYE